MDYNKKLENVIEAFVIALRTTIDITILGLVIDFVSKCVQ